MPEIKLSLIRGDRHEKLDYRDNLPVNMTAVIRDIEGAKGYLLSHDGLKEFTFTSGKARGGVFNERFNKHYRVSGNTFEEVSADGVVKPIGITNGNQTCSFAESFNTQAILSDGRLYYWDTATFLEVTDPELGFPIDITWFRGIYVMTDGDSLFHTDIVDETSISPLKYSSSEFSSDRILAVARNDQNQILAFNRYSVEYFVFNPNVPVGTSVLQVISGKASKIGIVGTHCKTEIDGMFFILGGRKEESPSVHILQAGQEVTIATREIDKVISEYNESELANVVMESRVVDRDKFLIIHLPDYTLLYNHTVGSKLGTQFAWYYIKTGIEVDLPWRGKFGVFDPRNTKWIYGDIQEDKLGYLDTEMAEQYGEQVEVTLYTPLLELGTKCIDEFEINTIPGFTDSDFTSSFSMSYDGITYGQEYFNLISAPSKYQKRYIARRLGYIRDDFNFKFRFVSRAKMAFSGLRARFS
jgi:hypothetical protein